MQSIFAMHQNGSEDLAKEEKFLLNSMDIIQDLYLVMLSTLTEMRLAELDFIEKSKKKHLSTAAERNPNLKFVNNQILVQLEESNPLSIALANRNINNWKLNDDIILSLLKELKQSDIYQDYMAAASATYEKERQFVWNVFTQIVATNERLYDYLEDLKLTWVDDIPMVNTLIAKQIKNMEPEVDFRVPKVFKDEEDKDFGIQLFRKTALNEEDLAKNYIDKTPNWDADRIAEIDTIILKMAICEFLRFPSIPVKVTINEYLEIAKEYSTSKSSIFINGILDNLVKEFQNEDKLNKTGRGLM